MKDPTRVLTLAFCALPLAGCPALEGIDHYSDLLDASGKNPCDYRWAGGSPVVTDTDELTTTTLRPECKAALEAILPFDGSWAGAPAGLKDRVTEAFQVLVGYPLAFPPQNRLMGVNPYAIPVQHVGVFDPLSLPEQYGPVYPASEDMNRNALNYVLNMIDTISYDGDDEGAFASYGVRPCEFRQLTIYDDYWSADIGTNVSRNAFIRAGTLVHEAHHGDGYLHAGCDESADVTGSNCDPDLNGPYGLQSSYLQMLLYGGVSATEEGKPILSSSDISKIASTACYLLKFRAATKPPALAAYLAQSACAFTTGSALLQLGIEAP